MGRILTYHIFEEQAKKQPHHPFLFFEDQHWTYSEFLAATVKVANWLTHELDVKVGEIVALYG